MLLGFVSRPELTAPTPLEQGAGRDPWHDETLQHRGAIPVWDFS